MNQFLPIQLALFLIFIYFTFFHIQPDPKNNSSEYYSFNLTNTVWTYKSEQERDQHSRPAFHSNDTDSSVIAIFKSSIQNDTQCHQKGLRSHLLCKLGFQNNCKRKSISQELSTFWIICPIYTANLGLTARLYELHRNFRSYIQSYGINFQTVEVIFPKQEFQLTQPSNQPYDLQYHDEWIFAMRENLVNVGIKHLPDDWQYMSWIDQHIFWLDDYWFEKAIWQMSHYHIVQLLNGSEFWLASNKTDYRLDGIAMQYYKYGRECWRQGIMQWGVAWAMRREIYERLGGLLDICIGTKCDMYQVFSYLGVDPIMQSSSQEYVDTVTKWQQHAKGVYQQKIGYVNSTVIHFQHCSGNCRTSDYDLQIGVLEKYRFSPSRDIVRDKEGRMSLVNLLIAREFWHIYGGEPKR